MQLARSGDGALVELRRRTPRGAELVEHAIARATGVPPGREPEEQPSAVAFARWAKEREARPAIGRVRPGAELRRTYGGEPHVVRCEVGGWRYRGGRFPTLASVVVAIAGARAYPRQLRANGERPDGKRAGAICSATRFFRL